MQIGVQTYLRDLIATKESSPPLLETVLRECDPEAMEYFGIV
jgi:hypothetical protein